MDAIRFKSVLRPENYGYVMTHSATDNWEAARHTPALLSYHALWFETLGDGFTQHTTSRPISANRELDALAVDWMLSLADHLLKHPEEHHYSVSSLFGYALPGREMVEFLARIKEPSEDKGPVYYSLEEMKTSASSSKRHDKRWFELQRDSFRLSYDIDRIADLYFVAQPESRAAFSILELIGVHLAIAEGLDRSVSFSASDRLEKWATEDLLSAGKVLRQTILAIESTRHAGDAVRCVIGNMRRARELAKAA
jgi:hypothetical protein